MGRERPKKKNPHCYPVRSPIHSTTCSDQFVLRDPRTDELLSNHPLLFSPTKYTTGLSYYGDLRRRNSVSPPFIPPPLRDPCPATMITSAIPNGRSHISLELRSSRPRRGFTASITFNEQLWPCHLPALALAQGGRHKPSSLLAGSHYTYL